MNTTIVHQVLLTRKEVSSYLKSSMKTVDRLIRDGRIRGFKIGSKVLIYANSVTEENINAMKPKFKNFK
jgi:excisionase family DNA binding protein